MELLNQLKRLWRALRGTPNSWPAIDLSCPAVVICIWLAVFIWGRAIAPLPAKLVKKLRQSRRAGR